MTKFFAIYYFIGISLKFIRLNHRIEQLSEYCDEIDSDIADNKQRYDEEAMKNIELENKIEKLSEVIDDLKYYVDYYDIKEAKDLLKENNIPVRKGKSINETITFMIGNPQYEDEED